MIRISILRTDRVERADVPPLSGDVRRRRRRAIVKLGLGALALAGVGAGVTAAAWTDDVVFTTTTSSGSVDLQGKKSDGTYETTTASVAVSGTPFASMVPGKTYTTTVTVKNAGSVCLAVTGSVTAVTEPLTLSPGATDAGITVSTVGNLAAGATKDVTLTVTTPTNWSSTHMGKSAGTATVTFTGTSDYTGAC